MEYRNWYDLGVKTSLLGFGAMRLKTVDGEIDEKKGFELFDKAYNAGVNYFDTARPYTNEKNESFVGKALKRYKRDTFYLASKFSVNMFSTREEAIKTLDIQLERLQTDYIDFYLMHALGKKSLQKIKDWGLMDVVNEWKKQGKIKHIGFSFHDDYDTFKEILDYYDWEFCQLQLNYMDVSIQQGIKGYYDLVERKIPVVVMEPVKGGKLASFNSDVAQDFIKYNKEASLASWALRWVGSLEGVKVILSGMNEEEQVIDNLKTFGSFVPLNEEEQNIVQKVKEKLEKVTWVGCTSCGYCMPCPMGVDIPAHFRMFNYFAMYNDQNDINWHYALYKKENRDAQRCVECNKCVSKCPQGIDIPRMLKELLVRANLKNE